VCLKKVQELQPDYNVGHLIEAIEDRIPKEGPRPDLSLVPFSSLAQDLSGSSGDDARKEPTS
jgi:hypothetical protein